MAASGVHNSSRHQWHSLSCLTLEVWKKKKEKKKVKNGKKDRERDCVSIYKKINRGWILCILAGKEIKTYCTRGVRQRKKGRRGKRMMVSKWQREEYYVWVRKHKGPSLHSILPITFVIPQWWCCQRLYYSVIIGQPSRSSQWPLNRLVKIVSVWQKKEIDFDFWGHQRTEQQKVLRDGKVYIIWILEWRSGSYTLFW